MRIIFLNLYSGAVERGAETFTHQLAQRLANLHKVTYLRGYESRSPDHQFSGSLIRKLKKRFFLDNSSLLVLRFTLKHLPRIVASDFDIVIPLNGFWQLLLLKAIQPFKGYKIVVTGHSGPGWDERFNLWLKPDVFIATTGPTLAWAKKISPWTKSVLIPYAINQSPSKKPFSLPNSIRQLEQPIILCPSALVPYKRVHLAIKAVSLLEQGSLLVLGKGPLRTKLNQLGYKLLGKKRFLITSSPHQHVFSYYQSSKIVTLSSHPQENSPLVFLEALAADRPVVTTDTPRNRWLLEGAAIYVNPTNTKAYAKALKLALNQKSVNTSTPLKKFSWTAVINQYEKALTN